MQVNRSDAHPVFQNDRRIETDKQPITAKMGTIISLDQANTLPSTVSQEVEILGGTFSCMKQIKKEIPGQNLIELNSTI